MPPVTASIRNGWRRYRALPTLPRELATFGLAALVSLTIVPACIWFAGQYFLGDYLRDPAGGRTGAWPAFMRDYIAGLGTGSMGHWLVLLGPYLMLVLYRVWRKSLRK
jgi:hypothetical protein